MKNNHIEYAGHKIDVSSFVTGVIALTIFKVDNEFGCLTLTEAKEVCKQLNKTEASNEK